MNYLFTIFTILIFACSNKANKSENKTINTMHKELKSPFYTFKMKGIDGTIIDFKNFKGKKVLIVNTASECGFTPQYKDLQQLHKDYGDKVILLGFPCNDFGGQEPGIAKDIQFFCEKNYGVTFQMFDKISLKNEEMPPLYQWLTDKNKNGWNDKAPTWNFCKYLINENGELIKFYPSTVKPLSEEILKEL